MSNILFVTPGPIKWVSSRMRAHWIAERIEGAEVMQSDKKHLSKGWDAVVFVKVIEEPMIINALQGLGTKVFWDICDPVHWFNPQEAREMADAVDDITASNKNLALDFFDWYENKEPLTIPDCIKLEHYPRQREHQEVDTVRFIWFGASQNRFSLFGAFAPLERLACNGVNISLTIYDDRPHEQNIQSNKFPVYYANWDLEQENAVLASHDIALLPPYPGPWGKVKSNNKELTAYANGLAVTDGVNYTKMHELANYYSFRKANAEQGLDYVKTHHPIVNAVEMWKELLCA